jgi:hypothetical protein
MTDPAAVMAETANLTVAHAQHICMPPGEARTRVTQMFRAMHPHLKVISAQLADSGFIAAAKRSVFSWATADMLGKTPIRAFGGLAEAADWLQPRATALGLACPSSVDLQAFIQARNPTSKTRVP